MKKIIVLPGKADSVFFMNEIDYITKHFDEIVIISYPGDEKSFSNVAKIKGFRYHIVKPNAIKILFSFSFYKWLFDKSTKDEIKNIVSFSKQGLTKLLYILYYGLFYIQARRYIDAEIVEANSESIYLYSFWLSRGAYTIANYNIDREKSIKRIVSRAHGYDLYEERNQMKYLPFRNFIDRNLDEIHFISKHGLEYFANKYGSVSHNSDKYISRLGTFNKYKYRKKIKEKDRVCIASCSSIIPVKRLDLIIDVIAGLSIPVEWIHIGTGSKKSEIEAYAAEKLKRKPYNFLGNIDNSMILSTYEEYDVDFFINMSDSEGVPVSIMEAMSMGIPVIARNVGGNSEIVSPSTGLLIESIEDMKAVNHLVNKEIENRIKNIQQYECKCKESIRVWDEKYNAYRNYEKFFTGVSMKTSYMNEAIDNYY